MKQETQKKKTALNNYIVSIFYQLEDIRDIAFFENVSVYCGNRKNAKKYATYDFLDRWVDNVGGHIEKAKEPLKIMTDDLETYLTINNILIFDDPEVQAKERVIEINNAFDLERKKENELKEIKRQEEERQRRKFNKFISAIPKNFKRTFYVLGIKKLSDLKHYPLRKLYLYSSLNSFDDFVQLVDEMIKIGIKPHDHWMLKKVDVHKYFKDRQNENKILTKTIFQNSDTAYPMKKMYECGLLPEYLNQFELYSREEFLKETGIGTGSVDWLELQLLRNGYKLKQ